FTQTSSGQNSAQGSGLGLVITQQFVHLMGGSIQVESKVNEGSTFTVDIYLEQASSSPKKQKKQASRVIGTRNGEDYQILVVDDKWENRLMLTRTLQDLGFDVREATNGYEAVEIWQDWQPNLVFMD